ncbi:hypothetical protein BDZ91DRAFT_787040 [Kalaharituber pfeilii]|nr:hypothetical protein BDZ91DRAFT_787040 [Kalaharituber pfeilii]
MTINLLPPGTLPQVPAELSERLQRTRMPLRKPSRASRHGHALSLHTFGSEAPPPPPPPSASPPAPGPSRCTVSRRERQPRPPATVPPKKKAPPSSPPKDEISSPQAFWARRELLVAGLFARLRALRFIHVRAPPATGKSTLMKLLHQHIALHDPGTPIFAASSWQRWRTYLNHHAGWDTDVKKYYLLIDEAQMTYHDTVFWNDYIKPIDRTTALPGPNPLELPRANRQTPLTINPEQRISLQPRPSEYDEGLGLLLTYDEYCDVVALWNQARERPLNIHESLLSGLWHFTQGHAGVVAQHHALRTHVQQNRSLTLQDLQNVVLQDRLLWKTCGNMEGATRGLPPIAALQNIAIASVFRHVIMNKYILEPSDDTTKLVDQDGLNTCFERGWLHADLAPGIDHLDLEEPITADSSPTPNRRIYVFPSRFHEWYVSCALARQLPPPQSPIARYGTPLDLALSVVRGFRPSQLQPSMSAIGPGSALRPLEATYRDEWYRSCMALFPSCVQLTPEFGGIIAGAQATQNRQGQTENAATGDIARNDGTSFLDFYLESCKWGFELVREGTLLNSHLERFIPGGRYFPWIPAVLSEWLVIDFRTTSPRRPRRRPRPQHQGSLVHFCFAQDYRKVTVRDAELNKIDEWILLETA